MYMGLGWMIEPDQLWPCIEALSVMPIMPQPPKEEAYRRAGRQPISDRSYTHLIETSTCILEACRVYSNTCKLSLRM